MTTVAILFAASSLEDYARGGNAMYGPIKVGESTQIKSRGPGLGAPTRVVLRRIEIYPLIAVIK